MGITQLIRFTYARYCPFTDSVHKVRLQPLQKIKYLYYTRLYEEVGLIGRDKSQEQHARAESLYHKRASNFG